MEAGLPGLPWGFRQGSELRLACVYPRCYLAVSAAFIRSERGKRALATKIWNSTAAPAEFKPFVSPAESPREFTLRAVVLGALFGVLFGAVSVYVGLRAGLTVSASIPIAVLSISILRAFGRSTILENNIVQTTGSAGESVAAGVIFTMPALIFLGYSLNAEYWRVFFLALLGGWLGVLWPELPGRVKGRAGVAIVPRHPREAQRATRSAPQ